MKRVEIGDRVLIAGRHVDAGKEGNVGYIGERDGVRGIYVDLDDITLDNVFVPIGREAWLVSVPGPVVNREKLFVAAIDSAKPFPHDDYREGMRVRLSEQFGIWAGFSGIVRRKTAEGYIVGLSGVTI